MPPVYHLIKSASRAIILSEPIGFVEPEADYYTIEV